MDFFFGVLLLFLSFLSAASGFFGQIDLFPSFAELLERSLSYIHGLCDELLQVRTTHDGPLFWGRPAEG